MGILKVLIFVVTTVLDDQNVSGEHWYHIPYTCAVLYDFGVGIKKALIGSCSILDMKTVLVSVDNFNMPVREEEDQFYYQRLSNIVVTAGTNFMDPSSISPSPKFAQTTKAKDLYVPFKPSFQGSTPGFIKNPANLSQVNDLSYGAFGVALNIGFLVVEGFTRSAFVRPIIVSGIDDMKVAEYLNPELAHQEKLFMSLYRCFSYTYNEGLNKIRYLEVTYVRKKDCINAYCLLKLSTCTTFPKNDHLACFKSTNYVDACPEARGAALFCDFIEKSVIGFLSSAPLCGKLNTPGVYTTLPVVLQFFYNAFKKRFININYIDNERYYLDDNSKEQWNQLH